MFGCTVDVAVGWAESSTAMLNKYQAAFLVAFLAVFASLLLLSRLATAWLNARGYYVSDIILIGLDTDAPIMSAGRVEIEKIPAQVLNFVKNLTADDVRSALTQDNLVKVAQTPAFLASAALFLGSAIYVKSLLAGPPPPPLNPNQWKEFPLIRTTKVSPNTAIYRFKLPRKEDVLGLPIGQHIAVTAEINGKAVTRNYTPVSLEDDQGYFELLIKTYEKGNISRYVTTLQPGDKLRVKGPKGNFKYTPDLCNHLSMLAGGTGIAPMVQIIRAILRNPADSTTISLIYANVNEDDILLRKELDRLASANGRRFKIYYVLNNPPAVWTGGVGFVTQEHIKEYLPNPNDTNSKLLICGPPPMVAAMKRNLEEINYPVPKTISKLHDKVFVF